MPQSSAKAKTTKFKRLCHSRILVKGIFFKIPLLQGIDSIPWGQKMDVWRGNVWEVIVESHFWPFLEPRLYFLPWLVICLQKESPNEFE